MTPFLPLLIFIIVRFIFIIIKTSEDVKAYNKKYNISRRRYKMNFRLRKINSVNMLFNGHYLDAKALYVLQTGKIPCIRFVGEIDGEKAFEHIKTFFANDIKHGYHHSYFDHEKKESLYNTIILVMPNERMLEISNNYCHIFHHLDDYEWAANMCEIVAAFRDVAVANANNTTQVVGFARQSDIVNH